MKLRIVTANLLACVVWHFAAGVVPADEIEGLIAQIRAVGRDGKGS